jgi:queuine/archaeosine tRNA-ribosyltransferase
MAGSAAGSLGPEDLREIGISAVAVDILELGLGFGWERIERLGGLRAFLGWDGPVVAVAGWSTGRAEATGRRAQALPQLISEEDGVLQLRYAIDGRTIRVGRQEISGWATRLGADPDVSIAGAGVALVAWEEGNPPEGQMVVSRLAQHEAHRGRFWNGAGWIQLGASAAAAGEEPLLKDCGCRACAIATHGYLTHLWGVREITAEHLLGWHNLHQSRLRVEEAAAGRDADG